MTYTFEHKENDGDQQNDAVSGVKSHRKIKGAMTERSAMLGINRSNDRTFSQVGENILYVKDCTFSGVVFSISRWKLI